MKYDIFHIVFCVVLFSIIFQGSLLPKVAEKCDMIDNSTDVMRTFSTIRAICRFSSYSFRKDNHPWKNRKICEDRDASGYVNHSDPRGAQTIVPKGQTVIQKGIPSSWVQRALWTARESFKRDFDDTRSPLVW